MSYAPKKKVLKTFWLSDPLRARSSYSLSLIPRSSSDRALTLFGHVKLRER
jgi:hypothetical protein